GTPPGSAERHRRAGTERSPTGTEKTRSVGTGTLAAERALRYRGMMTAQRWPRRARACGSDPATSARPPVLAKPTTSEAARRNPIGSPSVTKRLSLLRTVPRLSYGSQTLAATSLGTTNSIVFASAWDAVFRGLHMAKAKSGRLGL